MNQKYMLSDLVVRLQEKSYGIKESENLVRSFFVCLERALEQDAAVKIDDFGQLKVLQVDARQSIDVNTGERVEIKAHNKISFLPDACLKEAVNAPLAHLQPVALEAEALDNEEQNINMNDEMKKQKSTPKNEEKRVFEVQDTPEPEKKSENQASENKKKEGKKSVNWPLQVLCLIAIIGIVYAILDKDGKKEKLEPVKVEQTAVSTSTATAPEAAAVETPAPAQESHPEYDPASWPTLKVVTLHRGSRLTLLAQEYYGDKVFWVYIYEANKDRMENPNRLQAGMKIRIPQLPVSLTNAKDKECMNRARQLEIQYKIQFAQ